MGGKRTIDLSGVRIASDSSIEIDFRYNGKRCRERINLKPTPANLKRAARHRAAVLDAIERGLFDYAQTFPDSPRAAQFSAQPGAAITISRYLQDWWETEQRALKAATAAVDKRIVFNQLIPAFGDLTLTELRWPRIRDWIRAKDVGRKTQNNILSVLRRALAEALESELIDQHPMADRTIRRRKARSETSAGRRDDTIDPFSDEERQALISHASGQLRNLIQFGLWSGLRLSELFALTWSDIDWIGGRVYVRGALTQHAKEIEDTKTEAGERAMQLLPLALAALKAQKAYTFLAGNEVFQNPHTDKRWTGDLALRQRQWKTLLKRAGIRWRPPGQMRHTFASMCLMAGESPQWVAAQMGHRTWTFTAKTYYRWIPADAGEAGKRVAQLWPDKASG